MGKTHVVLQGEFLAKIAHGYGFADPKTIWDAPENKDLRQQRKNPNILFPGDELFIPDKEIKEESRSTEQKHRFEIQAQELKLRIVLVDSRNEAMKSHDCSLIVESQTKEVTTKSDGLLEAEIPAADQKKLETGLLLDRGKASAPVRTERRIPLKIGHLHPETKVSGQIARLNNLGYCAGELPDHPLTEDEAKKASVSPQFVSAVEEFQCDFHLQVDGVCGAKTQAKLVEIHGC